MKLRSESRRAGDPDSGASDDSDQADPSSRETPSSPSRLARPVNLTTVQKLVRFLLVFVCGIIFGVAMEKGRVHEPRNIRSQMFLERFIMVKMFVSAVSAGMFGFSLLAMLPSTQYSFVRTANHYFNELSDRGIVSSIIGGSLLGAGMTICGSCPTMVIAQVGACIPNAHYTLAGVLFGTLLYGVLKPLIDRISQPMLTSSTNPYAESPYFTMSLPLVVMFAMLVFAFEILIPWQNEIKVSKSNSWLTMKAWPPYVSGILIGLLQIPYVLGINQSLGGSSSYCTAVSLVLIGPLKKLSPFLAKCKWGFQNWLPMFYVGGALLGAYVSMTTSGSAAGVRGVPASHAFIGGALLLFGARTAGGCTTGHGLSGMGLLSILSFITVGSMFTGGIATAYAMKSAGLLGLYVK